MFLAVSCITFNFCRLIHFMGKSESGVVGTITIVFSMLLVSQFNFLLIFLQRVFQLGTFKVGVFMHAKRCGI